MIRLVLEHKRYLAPGVASAFIVFMFLVTPLLVGASQNPNCQNGALCNPLNNITTLEGLLLAILNIIKILMAPIIIFFIIYSGFLFVMAQGNAEELTKARRALLYALVGGVIIVGAEVITNIIENVVAEFQQPTE